MAKNSAQSKELSKFNEIKKCIKPYLGDKIVNF